MFVSDKRIDGKAREQCPEATDTSFEVVQRGKDSHGKLLRVFNGQENESMIDEDAN